MSSPVSSLHNGPGLYHYFRDADRLRTAIQPIMHDMIYDRAVHDCLAASDRQRFAHNDTVTANAFISFLDGQASEQLYDGVQSFLRRQLPDGGKGVLLRPGKRTSAPTPPPLDDTSEEYEHIRPPPPTYHPARKPTSLDIKSRYLQPDLTGIPNAWNGGHPFVYPAHEQVGGYPHVVQPQLTGYSGGGGGGGAPYGVHPNWSYGSIPPPFEYHYQPDPQLRYGFQPYQPANHFQMTMQPTQYPPMQAGPVVVYQHPSGGYEPAAAAQGFFGGVLTSVILCTGLLCLT